MVLKQRLTIILQATVAPIRERRAALSRDVDTIMDILRTGVQRGREITEQTKDEIVAGLGLFSL